MPTEITFEESPLSCEEWWVARIGDMLVWARLRVFESGPAQIFDCDGKTSPYDSEESARASLMDAEYRAFDGLDEDDAAALGFDLDSVEPPQADNDDALAELMFSRLLPRQ